MRAPTRPNEFDPTDDARRLRAAGVEAVLFLGSGAEVAAFARVCESLDWTPTILTSGLVTDSGVTFAPSSFRDRIYASFPVVPSPERNPQARVFSLFAQRHDLPTSQRNLQVWAYTAARLLEHGLSRAGRELSRDKLVGALEALYRFETGLTAPVTFGPNRRVGASEFEIVSLASLTSRDVVEGGPDAAGSGSSAAARVGSVPLGADRTVEETALSVDADDCEESLDGPDGVAAIVNGTAILFEELAADTEPLLRESRKHFAAAREHEVNLQINSALLEAEARRRGISAVALLQEEVVAKVPDPTDDEIRRYFDEHRESFRVPFAEARDRVISFWRREREAFRASELAGRFRANANVELNVGDDEWDSLSEASAEMVLASVDGAEIRLGDVDAKIEPLRVALERQTYDFRRRALAVRINSKLLDEESEHRGLSVDELLEEEIDSTLPDLGPEDVERFVAENRESLTVDVSSAGGRERVLAFLRERFEQSAKQRFARELRQRAEVEIFLAPPDHATVELAGGAASRPTAAPGRTPPVVLVAFSDFECASCRRLHAELADIAREFGNRLRIEWRHFPLSYHEHSFHAAVAAEAARQQGRFSEYAERLFENQKLLSPDDLRTHARELGLDVAAFDRAVQSPELRRAVRRDRQAGVESGVRSTPTVFIDGKRQIEKDSESLRQAIRSSLDGR